MRVALTIALSVALPVSAGADLAPSGVEIVLDTIGADYFGVSGTNLPYSVVGFENQEVMQHIPAHAEDYLLNYVHVVAGIGPDTDLSQTDIEIRVYFEVPLGGGVVPEYSVFADTSGSPFGNTGMQTTFGDPIHAADLFFPAVSIPAGQFVYVGWVAHPASPVYGDWLQAVESNMTPPEANCDPGTFWDFNAGFGGYLYECMCPTYYGIQGCIWGYRPPPIPGDVNGDGEVDIADFAEFALCLSGPNTTSLPPSCDAEYFARADLDDDDDVDFADYAGFQDHFVPSIIRGDIDDDGDVDLQDVTEFVGCITGPIDTAQPPDCDAEHFDRADFDHDDDVDLADYAAFPPYFTP